MGPIGLRRPLRNVVLPSLIVSRDKLRRVGRACRRRSEYPEFAIQFASVLFPRGVDVCAGRWRGRGHGRAVEKRSRSSAAFARDHADAGAERPSTRLGSLGALVCFPFLLLPKGASFDCCWNTERGVMYQSRKRNAAPCVSKTVDSGTLSSIWGSIAPEIRTKPGGRPADRRLPKAMTSPAANVAMGANNSP